MAQVQSGGNEELLEWPCSEMYLMGRLGKPFNDPVLAPSFCTSHTSTAFTYDTRSTILFSALQRHHAWAICSEKGVCEQESLSSCQSRSSQIAEIHRAQGTLLFCSYYPFKSPSSSFGNAIHLHKAHAFERERCPFWERFYFASTPVDAEIGDTAFHGGG